MVFIGCTLYYISGYRRVWHSGGITTYKTQLWMFPDLGFGLYVGTNGPPNPRASWALILILHYISDIVIEEPHWLNHSTGCSFPSPWKTPRTGTSYVPDDPLGKPFDDYVGTYSHPGFGDVIISRNKTTNRLTLAMGEYLTAELLYGKQEDTFVTKLNGLLWFTNDDFTLKFKHSLPGGEIDTLVYLLRTPYDKISEVKFTRGRVESSGVQTVNNVGPCVSGAGYTYNSVTVILIVQLIYLIH